MAVDATQAAFGKRILIDMARAEGLAFYDQIQVNENRPSQLEIWPPFQRAYDVVLDSDGECSYKTHLMRLIVLHDLRFIFEVLGQVQHVGSFITDNSIDQGQMRSELNKVKTGTVCQGRFPVVHEGRSMAEVIRQGMLHGNYFTIADYRYRSLDCKLLVDVDQPGATRCSSCLQPPGV
ncbi:hypothetical protein GHT06_021138 [Daphnia sinensis]|uniref:Uncharacterized protein n=1 Tax=Daphnia sinensis TaxID=1820382 RepID=A0AAD5KIN5_9CRUS|nr:hypothetical protein GHT06_021138 [Daphnia sinensis]